MTDFAIIGHGPAVCDNRHPSRKLTVTGATSTTRNGIALRDRLDRLDAALRAAAPGPTDEPAAAEERSDLLGLIAGYVRSRLKPGERPLVAVIFGVSGTGKSTLLNSLAQDEVGRPAPVRPGTRQAVVWGTAAGAAPTLPPARWVATRHPLAGRVSLVDTPPPDVAGDDENPSAVAAWLSSADLGIHVASATRYADAGSWELIDAAARRGLPLWFVLNRLPGGDETQRLSDDYAARLTAAGHIPSSEHVIAVSEGDPSPDHGALPEAAVAALAAALTGIDPTAAWNRALDRTMAALCERSVMLAEVLTTGARSAAEQRTAARVPYEAAGERLTARVTAGGLVPDTSDGWDDERDAMTRLVAHVAGSAAQQAAAAWDATAAGRRLLAEQASLWRHGPGIEQQAAERLEEWLDVLLAAARARYPRWWAVRRRRALAGALRRAAVAGADGDVRLRQLAGTEAGALVAGARADLATTLRGALAADGDRFARAVGDPDGAVTRADELAAAGRALADASPR